MSTNWNVIEGNWKQYVGKVKEQWGKISDNHITAINGKREILSGKIQEAYGVGIEEAEKQIKIFENIHKI